MKQTVFAVLRTIVPRRASRIKFVMGLLIPLLSVAQPVTGLEQRVRAYWDAKVIGDAVSAYEYEAVKAKDEVPLSKYVRGTGKLIYKEVTVLNIEIVASGEASALLEMQVQVPGMLEPLTTKAKDKWIAINGEWYHSPPKPRLGS